MQHIYDLCKGKNVCEGGDEMDTTLTSNQENIEDADKKVVSCPKSLVFTLHTLLSVNIHCDAAINCKKLVTMHFTVVQVFWLMLFLISYPCLST